MMDFEQLVYRGMANSLYGAFPDRRVEQLVSPTTLKSIAEQSREFSDYVAYDVESTRKLHEIINKKMEERKMKNIHWKVESLSTDFGSSSFERGTVEAKMTGYMADGFSVYDLRDLAPRIENIMNAREVPVPGPLMHRHMVTTPNPDRIIPEIKDVIFSGPATIVLWKDGTKTVVKAQEGEIVDYEKGLAMAISKRMLGNKGSYYDTFTKYLPKEEA